MRSFFPAFFAYEVRNITKKPKFGVSEKLPYLSCLSCTEKFNNVISFWHYLEGKGLNYQVNTENKPKFKFLSSKLNKTLDLNNKKSAWIVAKNSKVHHQICDFWPEKINILRKEYKIIVVDKRLINNIPKIATILLVDNSKEK